MSAIDPLDPGLLEGLMRLSYDAVPAVHKVRIFGEEYVRLGLEEGGELFLTRVGWARLPAVLPERWFADRRYSTEGSRLAGGTGNVFRIASPAPTKPNLNLVVKFARSGQDVPLHVAATFPVDVPQEVIQSARWNSPFEEFGLLHDLRRGRFGPADLAILTKRALAIYCPPNEYKSWQLGRAGHVWRQMEDALQHAQEIASGEAVHLHASRIYVMLFEWVDGENAEDCWKAGLLSEEAMTSLTGRVVGELASKGFHVIDNKPRHFILRPRLDGSLLRRNGELVYALIDFELLKRLPDYERWLVRQREADGT